MIKKILALLGLLLLIFAVFWGTRAWYTKESITKEEQSVILLEKIKTVAKLVTVEGYFSEMYDYQDYWKYDISPLRKKALVRIKAKVAVGYDLSQMKLEALPDEKRILISNLPDPGIVAIEHDLDYYDITEGTFNSFSADDYNLINKNAKEKIRETALASDLFLSAEEQSNQLLDLVQFMVEGAGWELEFQPRSEAIEVDTLMY